LPENSSPSVDSSALISLVVVGGGVGVMAAEDSPPVEEPAVAGE